MESIARIAQCSLLRLFVGAPRFSHSAPGRDNHLARPEALSKTQILATHARRWRMEMCLDDIKTTLGMEICAASARKWSKRTPRVSDRS